MHARRINIDADNVTLSAVIDHKDKLLSASRFIIVACGTSWHAGLIGQQLIENYCRIPVYVEYASEFRYRNPVILPTDVVIAISQSGETADTLAAIELARKQGAFVFGICNSVGASIPRGHAYRGLHPCGAGNRRGFYKGVYGAGDGVGHADAGFGQGTRNDFPG